MSPADIPIPDSSTIPSPNPSLMEEGELNAGQVHYTGDSALPSYTYYENSADYSGLNRNENILKEPLVDSPRSMDNYDISKPSMNEMTEYEMHLATNTSIPPSLESSPKSSPTLKTKDFLEGFEDYDIWWE